MTCLQVVGGQVGVELHLLLLLLAVENVLELLLGDFHHHVAEHLDEAPVAVVGKARVAGLAARMTSTTVSFMPRFRMVSIMPGMENLAPERTDTSRGFLRVAELLAQQGFEFGQRFVLLG